MPIKYRGKAKISGKLFYVKLEHGGIFNHFIDLMHLQYPNKVVIDRDRQKAPAIAEYKLKAFQKAL